MSNSSTTNNIHAAIAAHLQRGPMTPDALRRIMEGAASSSSTSSAAAPAAAPVGMVGSATANPATEASQGSSAAGRNLSSLKSYRRWKRREVRWYPAMPTIEEREESAGVGAAVSHSPFLFTTSEMFRLLTCLCIGAALEPARRGLCASCCCWCCPPSPHCYSLSSGVVSWGGFWVVVFRWWFLAGGRGLGGFSFSFVFLFVYTYNDTPL